MGSPLPSCFSYTPVLHVSEQIRVQDQVSIQAKAVWKCFPGPVPGDQQVDQSSSVPVAARAPPISRNGSENP